MTIDQVMSVIQVSFPQVYLACHTRHQRKRSTEHRLSQRDAAILAHLDEEVPTMPARLAAHLGIARSTLSEALKRLTALGFVLEGAGSGTGRTAQVRLSPKGMRAIRDTSVLETQRLRAALEGLTGRELHAIACGMERLAKACRRLTEPGQSGRIA